MSDRAEDAGALALTTEPHIVVVDLALRGADRLITGLRNQSLPHPVSIVALAHDPADAADNEEAAGAVDTVLSLPASPAWDESLVQVLQVPTRKQARYDVRFDVVSMLRSKPGAHRGLVLNISAGGLLVECAGVPFQPGDDVTLSLPIPGLRKPVEGRARVVRTPVQEHIGLRFEASRRGRRRERAAIPGDARHPAGPAGLIRRRRGRARRAPRARAAHRSQSHAGTNPTTPNAASTSRHHSGTPRIAPEDERPRLGPWRRRTFRSGTASGSGPDRGGPRGKPAR